jgi:hypothetical protein
VSSMNNTKTPYIIDFITCVLNQTIIWMNSFTRRRMEMSSSKVVAIIKSFPTICDTPCACT